MPIDFKGILTTRGRGYETPNLVRINEGLKPMPIDQRAAILGSIIEESGGNPLAQNPSGAYQGLLQWGADRYRPKTDNQDIELDNQIQYIKNTINNGTDGKSWTHGGNGSGYHSKDETYNDFHGDKVPFDKKFRALSYGYVRPQGKEDSYNNRLKVGKKVLNKLVLDEVLSKPKPDKIPLQRFGENQYVSKFKLHDDGGYLDRNPWNSLSMRDKAEMMRVAIANGITTLPEIRQAYNEFAKGGKMNNWTMQDEAGYRAWRSRLPRNLRETNDNDYDMRAAYKAGMQPEWNPDDKSYHLGSRDPRTGRILKAPHHPTFLKALMEDTSLGYYPTTDRNGNTYTSTWKANEFAEGGNKDAYIDADDRRHKVLLETKDGNLYDSKGNNYTQSYLDEDNVPVITSTMPRDTSRYYDSNATLDFINAAMAPISNFSPGNIVGSIAKAKDYPAFMSSFMNQDNNGFFTDSFAKEHPVTTGIGNFVGDVLAGSVFSKGMDLARKGQTAFKYSKYNYGNLARQYAKDGLLDDATLDEIYRYYYTKDNKEKLKQLRDAHFLHKANNPLLNDDGTVKQLYHTVGDKYNPNFNVFDTNIEGRPTAIYTTDGLPMSRSYSTRYNNTLENAKKTLDLKHQHWQGELMEYARYKKALENNDDYIISHAWQPTVNGDLTGVAAIKEKMKINLGRAASYRNDILNRKNYDPSSIKRLYSDAKKPISLDGHGRSWNYLPIIEDPRLRPFVHTDYNGRLSTRDYENAIRNNTDFDRLVIKDITDYGAGINAGSQIPYTVVENFNPSHLKYSDAAVYDDKGILIPLSKRDNFLNPDMRYADGGQLFANGGYKPSESIKRRIANWEGSSMKTNRSFEAEANDFNRVIPAEVRNKLTPEQLDGLYSYGYNVGMGKLRERVLPTLTAYTQGKATKEDVQRSMWASKDNQLRGLTTRRNAERQMFGGNYRTEFTGKGGYGINIDPSRYGLSQGFFDDINSQITIPQLQDSSMDIDPATVYKPPVIDETLFANPKAEEPVYNPQQDRMDNLQRFNAIMGLFGQSTLFAGLTGNQPLGILDYVSQIYN